MQGAAGESREGRRRWPCSACCTGTRNPTGAVAVAPPFAARSRYPTRRHHMIWLLVLILLILAVGGGIAISKFLFLLLIVVLVLALVGARGAPARAKQAPHASSLSR